jgi:ABC-type transport system involved in multi-copper enzyme maturation permease subunit
MSGSWNLTLLAAESVSETIPAWQWWTTLGVGAALLAALIAFSYGTRPGIVARATTKEAVRQPVFLLLLLGNCLVFLPLLSFIPYFTLGEDYKMLKNSGLMTILFSGLLLAVWTASTTISAEIEGKTTMTLLSKPINRRQFILGKYFGILQSILLLLIPVAIVFVALIYFKVGYDARESGQQVPEWFQWTEVAFLPFDLPAPTPERWGIAVQIVPGLALSFLEMAILTAVSVAIATRAPMVVNMVACFAIFVVGHLAPILVQASTDSRALEYVQFFAQVIATALPSLEVFNTEAAVMTETLVPPVYLGLSTVYCAAYSTAAILMAFILFEDRDLA